MIRIFLGKVGSGKTACAVREMALDERKILTYSNIKTSLDWQKDLTPGLILKKEIKDTKVNRKTGEATPVYEYSVNIDFWKQQTETLNVVLDEAHSILNSRRAMKQQNIIFNDWLALIRKILGNQSAEGGNLTFITQLWNRIDVVARDMAHQIRYHICHYLKTCEKCGVQWSEHSDMAEIYTSCPQCNAINPKRTDYCIEVFHFASMQHFLGWHIEGTHSFHKHYIIDDIENFFNHYDTYQIDNLF